MSLPVPVVWSEDCLRHEPGGEIWLGVRDPGTEVPGRALVLRDALTAAGAPVAAARRHDDRCCAVHDPALIEHLASIWADWEAAGLPPDYGQDRVVPYVFPTPPCWPGLPPRPGAVHARAGRYCYDTMTLVGPGTWAAIRAAVDVAATAADLVRRAAGRLTRSAGRPAITRPGCVRRLVLPQQRRGRGPGAARGRGGPGRDRRPRRPPRQRHAGDLLRPRRRLLRRVHVDPGAGWFPHFAGLRR